MTDNDEAFLAQVWDHVNNVVDGADWSERAMLRLATIIDRAHDLIHTLQTDRTPAQDYARGLERARIVAWLRVGADEFGRDQYLASEKALRSFADALEGGSPPPDDPPSRARAEVARLRQRLALIEEACEPFVKAANDIHYGYSDATHAAWSTTVGQWRRLAALFAQKKEDAADAG